MSKHADLIDRAAHKTLARIREEFEKNSWRLSANHIERELIKRMEDQIAGVFFALLGIEPNSLAKADDSKYRLSDNQSKISQMLQRLCEEKVQDWISANFERLWSVHKEKVERAMEGAILAKLSDNWQGRTAVERATQQSIEGLAAKVAEKFLDRYSEKIAELTDEVSPEKRRAA